MDTNYPFGRLKIRSVLHPRFNRVVHVIRHPLKQIAAFTAHTNKSYSFVYHSLKQILSNFHPIGSINQTQVFRDLDAFYSLNRQCLRGENCHVAFSAFTWVFWNLFVESFADVSFRIDDSRKILNYVCEILWPDYYRRKRTGYDCIQARLDYLSLPDTLFSKKKYEFRINHRQHQTYSMEHIPSQLLPEVRKLAERYNFSVY